MLLTAPELLYSPIVILLQVQGRGSLHAHIILWLHPEDVENVASEITAHIPAPLDEASGDFDVSGLDEHGLVLWGMVMRKQQHRCTTPNEPGCRLGGDCRYHFPHTRQAQRAPVMHPATNRYQYYSPRDCDRNTVPYHPMVRPTHSQCGLECTAPAACAMTLLSRAHIPHLLHAIHACILAGFQVLLLWGAHVNLQRVTQTA